jgi:hypothetical protein
MLVFSSACRTLYAGLDGRAPSTVALSHLLARFFNSFFLWKSRRKAATNLRRSLLEPTVSNC